MEAIQSQLVPTTNSMKVLIIDDARWQRKQLAKMLSAGGHQVIEAANGIEGLALLGENPDAIVCDLLMPVLDGFGFLEALRERGCLVPVIIVSADIQRTSRARCAELGACQFVPKPCSAEELLEAVSTAAASVGAPRC
jgi:CheY-like chemotaxis protein